LQELGARVVKVEAPSRPDGLRASHPTLFRALNDGKECRALDLRDAQDRDQFLGLVEDSLLVENMSGRVLPNLGLDASSLVAGRRSHVVSMRAFRRHPDWAGLGSVIELAGGLALSDHDGSPSFAPFPVTDVLAGAHGALVAVRALLDPPSHVAFGQVEDVAETIGDDAISAVPAVGAA
jgi:crotonobetainyl-CoA:carnitine CoA-transferase CaiB-like acyl-CoA transferase